MKTDFKSILVLLIFIVSPFISRCQQYDKIATKHFSDLAAKHEGKLNYTDENGLKQGFWIKYAECKNHETTECFGSTIARRKNYVATEIGKYYNNAKTGLWQYKKWGYLQCNNFQEYQIDYGSEGSFTVYESDSSTTTNYTSDSSVIKSKIIVKLNSNTKDSVFISCTKKQYCKAYYKKSLLKEFPFKAFYMEQERFQNNFYRLNSPELNEINN